MVSGKRRVLNRLRLSRAIRFRMGLQNTKWDETKLRYLTELVAYDVIQDPDEVAVMCDEVALGVGELYQETMTRWINLMSVPKNSVAYFMRTL